MSSQKRVVSYIKSYSNPKSFMRICRGSAPVPTLASRGNQGAKSPYNNYTTDLGLLYNQCYRKNPVSWMGEPKS